MLVERCLEKYVNKLLGNTEMEDALKRLDWLTQEEARMAAAENWKLTHTVDRRVEGVADRVQQTANDVDQMKRLSSFNLTRTDCRA